MVVFSGSSLIDFGDGAICRLGRRHCTMIATHARGTAEWTINSGELHETIAFTYSRDERLEMLKDTQLRPGLAELAADHIKTRILWDTPALPAFLRIARDAKANPYRGAAKQFFLESKALEMFSELVTLLDQGPQPDKTIGERELRHLNDIRDSLVARYDNPPSLIELSAEAGMNYKKLNHKFQQAFGATMHGFLREYRLEQGRKMIAQGQGVKETSYMLGYRHPSAFIYAYKRKFGQSPGGDRKPGNIS